ncbi:HAMP domain-containing protein [Sphingomonas sinipercae]|uniref:histidine kinase n=1 Tax=Sphingomonas sinipercae TaxID=2714944 RepID=A0A6G7ZNJ7_9SPHN|nr:ATP-binding protein [Sphingomonas sinipercae]QIL02498.1 HAMP domain-containing protein [Sphingomonas sinipercae]
MDAPSVESDLGLIDGGSWLARQRESGRFYDYAAWAAAATLIFTLGFSIWLLERPATPGSLLSPALIAALLIANLIPAIVLMVLLSRRFAMAHAARGGLGTGKLHNRLVALFSVIAAVPTVLVAIFASLLFQSGMEFWFSDRARNMIENTVEIPKAAYAAEERRVADNTVTMSADLADYLKQMAIDDPRFITAFGGVQLYQRELSEGIIFTYGADRQIRTLVLVNPYDRPLDTVITPERIAQLKKRDSVSISSSDRIGALAKLDYGPDTYIYAARVFDPEFQKQIDRGNQVLNDYRALLARSRTNQLRFNAALLLGSLIIVGLAILAALRLADRLVRPVGQLAAAAGRIEQGDFSTRVPVNQTEDEIQTLAAAFNQMTDRLEEQTGALKSANAQLETRRAFIEAVLSSVTAGVLALDAANRVLLSNRSAEELLRSGEDTIDGAQLARLSSELAEFMLGEEREANVTVTAEDGQRTLAVKRVRYQDGAVLTFDDITDQLSDQRSAAWADIAQRIAHEIKNPLTPIQLAAERLQRRFLPEVSSDKETFERLTGTIVRQVGDLRRMVDEFSNFARMPKPVFRQENLHEIARQALFLHEVAHPGITFALTPAVGNLPMVCDRRQLGQALTNIVKNAVEAIETRRSRGEHHLSGDRIDLRLSNEDEQLVIDVIDTGIGLPEDRERLTEPYITTRVRGTGLGLAIVKKIVEEHCGEIAFLDQPGGGTRVRIAFDCARLAAREHDQAADFTPDAKNDGNTDV